MSYCPECGRERQTDGSFCSNCGAELDDLASSGAPTSTREEATGTEDRSQGLKTTIIVSIGILSAISVTIGSFLTWGQRCVASEESSAAFSDAQVCTEYVDIGGLLNGNIVAVAPLAGSVLVVLLLADNYRRVGIFGSWKPRKVNILFVAGVLIASTVPIVVGWSGGAIGSGLIFLGCASMIVVSAPIIVRDLFFEKDN